MIPFYSHELWERLQYRSRDSVEILTDSTVPDCWCKRGSIGRRMEVIWVPLSKVIARPGMAPWRAVRAAQSCRLWPPLRCSCVTKGLRAQARISLNYNLVMMHPAGRREVCFIRPIEMERHQLKRRPTGKCEQLVQTLAFSRVGQINMNGQPSTKGFGPHCHERFHWMKRMTIEN